MNICGPRLSVIAIWLRLRSSHGFSITNDSALLTGLGRSRPGRHHDEGGIDLGHALVDAFELARVLVGVLQGGAFGRQHEADEKAAILGRCQFRFERFQQAECGHRAASTNTSAMISGCLTTRVTPRV